MTLRGKRWYDTFGRLAVLSPSEKRSAVAAALREIARPAHVREMLGEFIEDVQATPWYESDSYTHDNGFDKIVLFEDQTTKMKMRLHIWHEHVATEPRPRQNVHNHRWDFASAVLIGSVEHVAYRFATDGETGESFYHYRYYARGSKEHYDLESLGASHLIFLERLEVHAGEVYSVDNDILHRVDVGPGAAATLVITHENVSWVTNDLLSERHFGDGAVRLPSPAFTKHEVLAAVEEVALKLGAGTSAAEGDS